MTQRDSHGTCSCENYDGSCQSVGHYGGMKGKHVTHMVLRNRTKLTSSSTILKVTQKMPK